MLEFSAASPLNEVISRKKRMISYVHQTLVVVACYQKIEIIINMGISLQRTRRPDKPQKCVTEIFPRASFPSKFFSIKNTSIRYNSIQFVINVRFLNMVLIIFHYWINFVDWYQLETRIFHMRQFNYYFIRMSEKFLSFYEAQRFSFYIILSCSAETNTATFHRLGFTFVRRCTVVKNTFARGRHFSDNLTVPWQRTNIKISQNETLG